MKKDSRGSQLRYEHVPDAIVLYLFYLQYSVFDFFPFNLWRQVYSDQDFLRFSGSLSKRDRRRIIKCLYPNEVEKTSQELNRALEVFQNLVDCGEITTGLLTRPLEIFKVTQTEEKPVCQ